MQKIKILLVTEKYSPKKNERDGGARLVSTMKRSFGDTLSIMQFGREIDSSSATWCFEYPFDLKNRFERRIANANFIAKKIKAVEQDFTHVIFIHISMQFGLVNFPLKEGIEIWTFPMFLTPSYRASGEIVPENYFDMEHRTLTNSKNILTPSHLERRQLMDFYSVSEGRINVVPRGIDNRFIVPKIRFYNGSLNFCSIGSIKPQKNTLGLICLFKKIHNKFPNATLKIIGPIQNSKYFREVLDEICKLKINEVVDIVGYVSPDKLSSMVKDSHFHLSVSTCETFGRSIFETLALGLPNIARKKGNAAAEFLKKLPYAKFVDDDKKVLDIIEKMLKNFSKLSSMALEIGRLYDDEILSRLLVAKILSKDAIAISDFDGTLFHKDDPEKTKRCIKSFQKFPIKVLCSARPIDDLLEKLALYNLKVDWIIGYSGAVVTNGFGELLWYINLNLEDVFKLEKLITKSRRVEFKDKILQIKAPIELLSNIFGFRIETYQNTSFIANWKASKLHAVYNLLNYINWNGQVFVFGDGPYDDELLTYFDGIRITSEPSGHRQKKEIVNV
ncbi:MAG: glycosyltransferase [Candidatus Thorarchaeota archaeon]